MSQDDETFGVVEKPKRVPRKRVVTPVEHEGQEPPVSKKRTSQKKTLSEEKPVTETKPTRPTSRRTKTLKEEVVPERKAPTAIAATRSATKTTRRQIAVVALLIIVGIGASAGVGFTDKGSIDVSKTIALRNEKITRGEVQGEILQAQNSPQLPDGGLTPAGAGTGNASTSPNSQSATPTSTTTASSSQPVGHVPMTNAEAAAAAAKYASTSKKQSS